LFLENLMTTLRSNRASQKLATVNSSCWHKTLVRHMKITNGDPCQNFVLWRVFVNTAVKMTYDIKVSLYATISQL